MTDSKTLIYSSRRSLIWKAECQSKPVFVSKEFFSSSKETSLELYFHENLSSSIDGIVLGLGKQYDMQPKLYLEYCANGSLRSYLETLTQPLSETQLLAWYSSMIQTLRDVHLKRIVHRIINSDNWLVTSRLQVKLTDFGYALLIEEGDSKTPNSLKNDDGERTGLYSVRIFAEDVVRLARVFYQMATFDFTTTVLSLQPREITDACRRRGYSSRVCAVICKLRNVMKLSSQKDIVGLLSDLENTETVVLSDQDLVDIMAKNDCSYCHEAPGIWSFPICEHMLCNSCGQSVFRGECELCQRTTSTEFTPQQHPADFNFSSIDFSRLS